MLEKPVRGDKNASTAKSRVPFRAGRSPAYPMFDLGAAIEKTGQLYYAQRMNSVHLLAALESLGYKTINGTSQRTIAALISYGLLSEDGSGATRKVAVTDLARRILLIPDGNPERVQLLREAALRPKVFREMVEQWPKNLPNEAAIRHHLIFDKGYHEDSVGSLIEDFKSTYLLAELGDCGDPALDISESEGTDATRVFGEKPRNREPDSTQMKRTVIENQVNVATHRSGTRTLTIPMPHGREALLQIPTDLSESDFKFLEAYLGLMKDALIGTVSQPTEEQAPNQIGFPRHEKGSNLPSGQEERGSDVRSEEMEFDLSAK